MDLARFAPSAEDLRGFDVADARTDRKRRATRQDRIPTALVARMDLRAPQDYLVFLPDGLGEAFTVKDLARAARIDERLAGTTLQVMTRLGTTRHAGKQGRAYVHTRNSE